MAAIHSILFVCTGNSCRSVMAEALMKKRLAELGKDDIEVVSAGVRAFDGFPATAETITVMNEVSADVSAHETTRVTAGMIEKADLILAMEHAHKDEIIRMVPAAASKTFLLKEYRNSSNVYYGYPGVSDPIGKPVGEYRLCRDEIDREIKRIAELL